MPKRKPFVCKACGRRFLLAMHLARHARVHGGGAAPPERAGRRRRAIGARRQTAATSGATSELFAKTVAAFRSHRDQLAARQSSLAAQIASIDGALAALGQRAAAPAARAATPAARSAGAPSSRYRPGTLKDRIARVLASAGRPLRVMEVTAALKRAGQASKSKQFPKKVNMALAKMADVKRIGRGVYTLR